MHTDRWEIGAVVSQAWEVFKVNAAPFLIAGALLVFVGGLFVGLDQGIRWALQHLLCGHPGFRVDSSSWAAELLAPYCGSWLVLLGTIGSSFLVNVLSFAVSTFLSLGLIRMSLKAVRGEQPEVADLFSGFSCLVPGLLANFLTGLAIAVGLSLCLVPGVILSICLMFTLVLVVDRGLGPIEAMRESFRLTEGERTDLFLWLLVSFVLGLAGLVACCVGVVAAVPVISVGTALIYLNLQERKAA